MIGAVYYTDNQLSEALSIQVRATLRVALGGAPIVSVGVLPADYLDIVIPEPRGYLTMFKQILAGLEALDTKYAFLVEHDVLYNSSHFQFRPPWSDMFFYNLNCWKVDVKTGHGVTYTTKQTSQLVADRELLVKHYRKRVELVKANGFSRAMGFEPGSHGRVERVDDYKSDVFRSASPNFDLRHDKNLTESRWSKTQFRSQRNCRDWQEAEFPHLVIRED